MADTELLDPGPPLDKPKFSISGEDFDKSPMGDEEKDIGDGAAKGKSRFKVAKVEFIDDKAYTSIHENGDHDSDDGAADEEREQPGEVKMRPSPRPYPNRRRTNSRQESVCSQGSDGETYNQTYDTRNLKTFGRNTLETLPHLDHYRNLLSATGAIRKRPTLLELHDQEDDYLQEAENGHAIPQEKSSLEEPILKPAQVQGVKFGWIKGVLVRCLLNIWGVMLFLRLSWVVGQAGIGLACCIILLASLVTTITALSMSAICTNGEVKGGGAYYMISRSLGPEFGGAIGLIFSVANAVAVAMYVVGFAETIRDILKDHGLVMVDAVNDVRIIGLITIIFLLGIALIGMEWEAMAQMGLLVILLVAIADFLIGTLIPSSPSAQAKGFVGFRGYVFMDNLGPDFRNKEDFFSVFAIFFPAATGILAGANISGDLKDAQRAIPKGTLLAILLTTLTYLAMAIMAGTTVLRDASGLMFSDLLNTNTTGNLTEIVDVTDEAVNFTEAMKNSTMVPCSPPNCRFGLHNDMQVMQLVAAWGPLIIAGIICATLSSALASLVSAPKVFQAVCKDKIFPGIHVFAKGYGKNDEPRRGYCLTFLIGLGCICIGDLNAIAPLISNFFLISYALINYSCFDASLAKSPGWRPAFRYYSMWLSLFGALLCIGVMFVINWWSALITLAFVTALYLYVHYRKPEINWGSSTQAHQYRNALQSTLKLLAVEEHVKNYRPQTLVLSGFPSERPALVDFAYNITKNTCVIICGHILRIDEDESLKDLRSISRDAFHWLHKRKVKAFYQPVISTSRRAGAQALMQCCGLGKMRPNLLLIGFKSNWQTTGPGDVEEYINIVHDAFDLRWGVGILHLEEGLHTSNLMDTNVSRNYTPSQLNKSPEYYSSTTIRWPDNTPTPLDTPTANISANTSPTATTPVTPQDDNSSNIGCDEYEDNESYHTPKMHMKAEEERPLSSTMELTVPNHTGSRPASPSRSPRASPKGSPRLTPRPSIDPRPIDPELQERFHNKQKKGTIDVWWLFDDGGLTLLVPYLLSTKSYWRNCKLRVFSAASKPGALDRDQRHMATLLSKFRIDYHDMIVIPDMGKRPREESAKEFKDLIKDWMLDTEAGETPETHPWKIQDSDLSTQKDKTNRHIRLRELLLEHSSEARLIVLTLPMPRRGMVSSGLYMAWIDTLTRGMPPILLLRGNQESVLTFYS